MAGNDEDDGCEDYWVNVSARAGGLWLRVGLVSQIVDDTQRESEMDILRKEGTDIAKECEGLGGTLQAIGAVLTACLSKEFLVAKYVSLFFHVPMMTSDSLLLLQNTPSGRVEPIYREPG